MKNEYIIGATVLLHNYTSDNSEILFAQVYSDWANVEKASKRNQELIEEAWPDQTERDAFFDRLAEYYSNMYSDEIYSSMSRGKQFSEKPTEPLIYYLRTTNRNWPEDGEANEIKSLRKDFVENVIHKNEKIIAYYPMQHLYGADSREITEVFLMNSMADLEETNNSATDELVAARWPDEDKKKEFFDSFNKYRTAWHGDLIYTSVPELAK